MLKFDLKNVNELCQLQPLQLEANFHLDGGGSVYKTKPSCESLQGRKQGFYWPFFPLKKISTFS